MNSSTKEEKICIVCSNVLGPRRSKYCSEECKRKNTVSQQMLRNKDIYTKVYNSGKNVTKTKKKSKKLDRNSLEYINELARAEGLSYGQYVGKHGL